MSHNPFPRFPPAGVQNWTDDAETVIFGDDLLEDVAPPPPASGVSASPLPLPSAARSAPDARPVPGGALSRGRPPDSGVGSLRPYVGNNPQIRPGTPAAVVATIRPVQKRRGGSWSSGFGWGAVIACIAFAGVIYKVRGNLLEDGPKPAVEPTKLDGDKIPTVGPQGELAQAREGSAPAIAALEARRDAGLSADEVMALALGKEAQVRKEAQEFAQDLAKKSSDEVTDEQLEKFFSYVTNQRTFRSALLPMATSTSELGPDLIYAATRRSQIDQDISEFAMQLLLAREVGERASPALEVVIDAEKLTVCSEVRSLVDRALEHADSRAVRHMAKFAERQGCGEYEQDDCYPCLRSDRALVDALRAAQDRPPPPY